MKHIKIYEKYKEKPEVGDYILTNYFFIGMNRSWAYEYKEFIHNNIGQIKKIEKTITVKYTNIPQNILRFFDGNNAIQINYSDIIYFSKNKEDIEEILTAKKYNL